MNKFVAIGLLVILGLLGAMVVVPALADGGGQNGCPFHQAGGVSDKGCCGGFSQDGTNPTTDTSNPGGNTPVQTGKGCCSAVSGKTDTN